MVAYSRHHTSDFIEKPEYTGSVAQLRRTALNDEATKIADAFDGKLPAARACLRGSGGEETLTAWKRKRVQAALRRYQRRVGDLTQADTQTRGVNRRTLEAFSNYDKRFGPRLATEEGRPMTSLLEQTLERQEKRLGKDNPAVQMLRDQIHAQATGKSASPDKVIVRQIIHPDTTL